MVPRRKRGASSVLAPCIMAIMARISSLEPGTAAEDAFVAVPADNVTTGEAYLTAQRFPLPARYR